MIHYSKHPLDYCRERVRRAEEHIAEFEREVVAMHEKQAHAVPFDLDPNPPHAAINVGRPAETFAGVRLGTLVGETAYNLRCALDYLVFELAKIDSGSEQKGTQFPIMDTAENFAGRSQSMLKGINPSHVTAIEGLQPYNGCDWARLLRDVSNMDKHRQIVPGSGFVTCHVHSGIAIDLSRIRGAFDRKAKHPLTGADVDVKVHIASTVAFKDGDTNWPVTQTLNELKTGVADTLRQFESEF